MTLVTGCGHQRSGQWITTPCAPWSAYSCHEAARLLSSPRLMLWPPLASASWRAYEAVHAEHPLRGLQHCQRLVPSRSRMRGSRRQCSTASASHCCQPMRLVSCAAAPWSTRQKTATTRWCALRGRGRPLCTRTSYPGFCTRTSTVPEWPSRWNNRYKGCLALTLGPLQAFRAWEHGETCWSRWSQA
jgi:hypothetical protein